MTLFREIAECGSRPYPLDRERRRRVLVALAERDMTISALARCIGLSFTTVSKVISGRRLSTKTEQRIADYLGKPADWLFPFRPPGEIGRMRRAEEAAKGRAV